MNTNLSFDADAVLEAYDHDQLQSAIAYGSGVVRQEGYENEKPMVDMIFAVEDSQAWHEANMRAHPKDYSFMRYFGAKAVTNMQRNFAAGIYYNPYVQFRGQPIKYGVIEQTDLQADLQDWRWFYTAGRLQKPTVTLKQSPALCKAQQQNIRAALSAALLLLPEQCTEDELYQTITKLSYLGDPRPENPDKVQNIVHAQRPQFRAMYANVLADAPVEQVHETELYQEHSKQNVEQLVAALPSSLELDSIAPENIEAIRNQIRAGIANTVSRSGTRMIIQGALSAGSKSIQYAIAKLRKRFKAK